MNEPDRRHLELFREEVEARSLGFAAGLDGKDRCSPFAAGPLNTAWLQAYDEGETNRADAFTVAWFQGLHAAHAGDPASSNPYAGASDFRYLWNDGYHAWASDGRTTHLNHPNQETPE